MSFHLDPEYVSRRLGEVGATTEDLAVVVQDDESTWTLAFNKDTDVLVLAEWADEPARLVLSADIGTPLPARAVKVHHTALSYNLLWRETGGARIGMGGAQGDLLLLRELDADCVQGQAFADVLNQFAETARWWEGFVRSSAEEEKAMATSADPGVAHLLARI
ncbi:type III secretion system chaperone [Variovorax sp. KK3]|uniref:type III secretion system chaperone n=1 Tax=Variovorax sp. KK3 TaxID=1855728 RepID=UPI00097BB798|nr:type III secretion system chaperone [Variovorax sp. KK3]